MGKFRVMSGFRVWCESPVLEAEDEEDAEDKWFNRGLPPGEYDAEKWFQDSCYKVYDYYLLDYSEVEEVTE